MRLMVIDRSGRGHALAEAIARTDPSAEVHYVPGCDGLGCARISCAQDLSLTEPEGLVDYAKQKRIDFVVVANVLALAAGAVDAFERMGIPVLGPNRAAARLETSKVFAKQLFEKYGVPTPEHRSFSDPAAAFAFLKKNPDFRVVKADGLCGGNGAFVCDTLEEAVKAVDRLMRDKIFGASGEQVVIERRIHGTELSFFAILDGVGSLTLPMAVDYPKADDGNRGPISGGMGALSHHPLDTPSLVQSIQTELLRPLTKLIQGEGLHYTGFIYLGVMISDNRPVLLETNVRMGDPEAEVILPRIESDLTAIWTGTLKGKLSDCELRLGSEWLCDVVATQGPVRGVAADGTTTILPGWPFGAVAVGHLIHGLRRLDRSKCHVFVGEARRQADGALISNGGRVVHVVGRGHSMPEARQNAYENIGMLWFEGMRYRHDIGAVMPWEYFP